MAIVRRKKRENRVRKTPEIGAGRRRSQMHAKQRSARVKHDSNLVEQDTPLGALATIFKGPYEVFFEVLAPGASTGTIVSDTGTLTILGRTGTLYVRLATKSGEKTRMITSMVDLLQVEDVDESVLDLIMAESGANTSPKHRFTADELTAAVNYVNGVSKEMLEELGIAAHVVGNIVDFLGSPEDVFTEKLEQLRVGDRITILPGQQYSLSTGDSSVDILRIHTANYFETITQLTSPILPDDRQYQAHITEQKSVADDVTLAQGPRRTSYSKAHREKIAALRVGDRNAVSNRKKVTRQVRVSKRPDEVIQDGMPFRSGATLVRGVNPRPMGASLLADGE